MLELYLRFLPYELSWLLPPRNLGNCSLVQLLRTLCSRSHMVLPQLQFLLWTGNDPSSLSGLDMVFDLYLSGVEEGHCEMVGLG